MKRVQLIISGALVLVIAGLCIITLVVTSYRAEYTTGDIIAKDVAALAAIFERIHAQCKIMGFDGQQNIINFLNVKSFDGSEVGPMNLAYPTKWQGPYLPDNLEIQGKEYMVVKIDDGYFITPGNGVKLPNKKVIGTDIMLDAKANILSLIASKELSFNGKPLAQRLA